MLRRSLLVLFLVVWHITPVRAEPQEIPPLCPSIIDAIEIHGLWRTAGFVVQRELPWRPGDLVTPEAWELGIQRLWNLGVFSQVGAHLERRDHRIVAVFDLEERWTVNLLLRFGFGGGADWVRVGLWDINNFGRYVEAGGFYERFETHNGGEVWIRNPRLFDRRLDGQITIDQLVRERPTYADVRTSLRLDLTQEQRDDIHYGVWTEGMLDSFLPGPPGEDVQPNPSKGIQFGTMARFGVVNIVRLRPTGWSLEVRPSIMVTDSQTNHVFGGAWLEWLWFRMVGERWTLAWRSQAGAQSNSDPEFHFFLGGLDLIRGYADNFIETQYFGLANVEVRFIAFDSMWFAVQPAAFVDGAIARGLNGSTIGALSAGVGVRFMIPRFVHSGIRIDAAFPLAPREPLGLNVLSVGVYQFF